jgi:hypothetical protein
MQQKMKSFKLLRSRNDLSNIILGEMAPVISLYPFSLATHLLTNLTTPVAVIQSSNGFSYFDFPKSWPNEVGRFPSYHLGLGGPKCLCVHLLD